MKIITSVEYKVKFVFCFETLDTINIAVFVAGEFDCKLYTVQRLIFCS